MPTALFCFKVIPSKNHYNILSLIFGSDDRRHDENTLPDAGINPAARAVPRALALLLTQLLQVRLYR